MRIAPELSLTAAIVLGVTVVYVPLARAGAAPAAGLLGHTLGVLGLLAMLAGSFAYTWRKRPHRTGPGSMQRWLQAHIVTGIAGPYAVLLHSTFAYRGIAGVTLLLVLVVVASGLVGRYVYAAVPKLPSEAPRRRALSWWWLLHVPLALAMFALALVHAAAALYYATLLK